MNNRTFVANIIFVRRSGFPLSIPVAVTPLLNHKCTMSVGCTVPHSLPKIAQKDLLFLRPPNFRTNGMVTAQQVRCWADRQKELVVKNLAWPLGDQKPSFRVQEAIKNCSYDLKLNLETFPIAELRERLRSWFVLEAKAVYLEIHRNPEVTSKPHKIRELGIVRLTQLVEQIALKALPSLN